MKKLGLCGFVFLSLSLLSCQQLLDSLRGPAGPEGSPGVSVIWQGSMPSAPAFPRLNWAYYNTTLGIAMIYDGDSWEVLATDGAAGLDGADGTSIIWQGSLASAPVSPALNWAYYNTTTGSAYVFDGLLWQLLAMDGSAGADGADGISIYWRGSFAAAPVSPSANWAYYNSTVGIAYVWDGSAWQILAVDGADGLDGADGIDGVDGTNGIDGTSILWQGSLSVAPVSPGLNWAYYNSTVGIAYIWDGSTWQILAVDGVDGLDGVDGIDGTNGIDGADGISILWKGSLAAAPASPGLNWAYYNTMLGTAFVFDGLAWQILAVDGSDAIAPDIRLLPFHSTLQNAICEGDGVLVAVGQTGWVGRSIDGLAWTEPNSGSTANLNAVAYGNGYFVAVGNAPTGGTTLLRSVDGTNWSAASVNPGTTEAAGLAYGNGVFVAVGYGVSTNALIMTSVDGDVWSLNNSGDSLPYYLLAAAYEDGQFIAVGGGGMIVTSVDGTGSWISRVSGSTSNLVDIAKGNGRWIALAYGGSASLTSVDGVTWSAAGILPNPLGLAYGNGLFVIVGESDLVLYGPGVDLWSNCSFYLNLNLSDVTWSTTAGAYYATTSMFM